MPKKVLIFGSCVSRDAFEDAAGYEIAAYYARSSFAAMSSLPSRDTLLLDNITSKFQRRMVEADMMKRFLPALADLKFDCLLIDFIDERFSVSERSNGAVWTISSELLAAGLKGGRRILSGSDEHFQMWQSGWDRLMSRAQELGITNRVIVAEAFWASNLASDDDGPYSAAKIAAANQYLDQMYAYIGTAYPSIKFIRYPKKIIESDCHHKWGPSPFHYSKSFYRHTIAMLEDIIQMEPLSHRAKSPDEEAPPQ